MVSWKEMQITLTYFKLIYCLKYINVFQDKPYFNAIQVDFYFLSLDFFFCKRNLGSSFDPHLEKSCFF